VEAKICVSHFYVPSYLGTAARTHGPAIATQGLFIRTGRRAIDREILEANAVRLVWIGGRDLVAPTQGGQQ